ncbi:BppU family phage baseplate upper protein [Lactobacillus gasseri]|uniref:BppU family phage baseplate upper protein n=1 Tax=Lactobacillus gasseri TaxID=1596 RepID=UPI0022AC2945|nr:BppU family phage baseplate upper protein [Lactobacillus gasseri]MCZ3553906.1 BppU family phage baseplate upper protein [Lactobacillus gasseri]
MLQAVTLSTNKQTTNLSRVEVRDSDKGEILESFILNPDGTPYDLTNKSLVFNENKDGDKFVSDSNVTIVDARIGHITYQVHDQVHSARGTAWFDIIDKASGAKFDSTADFYIEVRDGLKCTVYNTTYISDLEKLKQQMETLLKQADGELQAELQKAEQQLDQELQNFRNQYNSLSADFQNQFNAAQNARQQDYTNQKNAINQDWTNNKNQIWGQWNGDKANIDKQAQDTIQAIKDNAKQVLDKDQADWNAKQHSWDDTFSRIVKEWQVKTNSLNNTVQDLTTKFGNIINELTDLMNKKLPDMNAKTDAVQKKVDQLRTSLGQIDWTTFSRRTDNSGGVNLLPNTATLKDFSTGHYGDSDAHNGISIDPKSQWSSDTNINLVKTKIAHVWGDKVKNAPLVIPGGVYLPAGTYTLSFLARTNGIDDSPIFHFGLYSDWTNNHGGAPLATSDAVNNKWGRHQITFSIPESYYHTTLRIQQNDDAAIPGGSIYFANLKLESGSIATDWCPSYLDFDRLDGRHDMVDSPDFNTLTSTGIYFITQPDHGRNYPVANGGILKVDNAHDSRIEQTYYEDTNDARIWHRQYVESTWKPWKQIPNSDEVLPVSGGSMQKGSWINWDAQSPYNAHEGNIGGIQWNGASDSIKIFGDNNASDNLDLAIQLGDDDSNHISFRRADGDEVAAINMDGYYTGSVGWNNIRSKPDVAQKSDLNVNVIRDYNIETDQPGPTTVEQAGKPVLVDQATLATFARAYRDVRNHTDYRYPTDQALNTAINLNSDPYLDTGIYKIGNCATINGPWPDTTRRWYYLTVIKYDDNTIYQTIDQGPERFVRTVSKTTNSYPQWDQFATMNRVKDLSDRLQGFTMQQTMFQHRVDYDSPSGTISNQTVDFNAYKETGILKVINCYINNGPYKIGVNVISNYRHTVFLKITHLDGQTQYQTVYEGDNLYGRKLYNGSGQWHKYTNTPI